MTLIFCVLLKINREDLDEELPGGMDMLGSALVFVNTSVPGGALVVGVLMYGLGAVMDEAQEMSGKLTSNPLLDFDGSSD